MFRVLLCESKSERSQYAGHHMPSAPSEPAKPAPPKHTSMRHAIDGMNFFSFSLHVCLEDSNFGLGQLLMSGRFDCPIGVFWMGKIISACATPVVPTRARICNRSSSAWLPLKLPQCPS